MTRSICHLFTFGNLSYRLECMAHARVFCSHSNFTLITNCKVTRELELKSRYRRSGNFYVKNNSRKKFCVVKFLRFRSIREIFLTVDDCNMDEYLESFWSLVYYQVSGEPGIARHSRRPDIYFGSCGLVRKLIH